MLKSSFFVDIVCIVLNKRFIVCIQSTRKYHYQNIMRDASKARSCKINKKKPLGLGPDTLVTLLLNCNSRDRRQWGLLQ